MSKWEKIALIFIGIIFLALLLIEIANSQSLEIANTKHLTTITDSTRWIVSMDSSTGGGTVQVPRQVLWPDFIDNIQDSIRWTKSIFITRPDTIPNNLFYFSNMTGSSITIDSIRFYHNSDSLAITLYRRNKNESSEVMATLSNQSDTLFTYTSLSNNIIGINGETGFSECTTSGDTTATFLRIEYFGSY